MKTAHLVCSGLLLLASVSLGSESKVYYDYNYRVLPAPVRQRPSESRQSSSHSRSRPSWLPAAHRDEYVIDYYDPEEEFGERQDPGLAAGVSVALIGMAFSAAFTGAVIAPIISGGVARMVDTVQNIDIRMPTFPKDVFEEDYAEYEEYEENEKYDDKFETEIIEAKKKGKKSKKSG